MFYTDKAAKVAMWGILEIKKRLAWKQKFFKQLMPRSA
jgi:hypothetical protein